MLKHLHTDHWQHIVARRAVWDPSGRQLMERMTVMSERIPLPHAMHTCNELTAPRRLRTELSPLPKLSSDGIFIHNQTHRSGLKPPPSAVWKTTVYEILLKLINHICVEPRTWYVDKIIFIVATDEAQGNTFIRCGHNLFKRGNKLVQGHWLLKRGNELEQCRHNLFKRGN